MVTECSAKLLNFILPSMPIFLPSLFVGLDQSGYRIKVFSVSFYLSPLLYLTTLISFPNFPRACFKNISRYISLRKGKGTNRCGQEGQVGE